MSGAFGGLEQFPGFVMALPQIFLRSEIFCRQPRLANFFLDPLGKVLYSISANFVVKFYLVPTRASDMKL
jgi:hypothetical protein